MFFFFFKKKTAYEMRISDWSSDVCSSDLDYYCQSRRGNRLFDLGLGDIALAFTAASSKTDQIRIDELVKAHGQNQFAAAWLRHRGLIRSEEHTSELQSLMRISYAVFCLKKNTKKYKTHNVW